MRKVKETGFILFLILTLVSCISKENNIEKNYLSDKVPGKIPISFKPELVPKNKIIHKGIFSPDLSHFFYTISDKNFSNFTVYTIRKKNGIWTKPEEAFFNSKYDEHGMSFSPDGNSLYFSSTRPVYIENIASTWHIWKSEKINGEWTTPVYVDIPNLRKKLISHPTISNSRTLYFHSSNLDYSEMEIYSSKLVKGKFQNAEKVPIPLYTDIAKCTPYISPDEKFMIFASIGDQLDLYISYKDSFGNWSKTDRLNGTINTYGQGNPYVTPDDKFLLYTVGRNNGEKWNVKWLNITSELKND
ncbi:MULTISPECIES: hypothetical protein [unclassified Croceitalea]|uniref:hypothetical protein n=1 Tax=unclassified Croceitalea TaxID=2632280 RepID=UPI0030D6E3C3